MTKTKKTYESKSAEAATAAEFIEKTFGSFPAHLAVPAAAREFVKRNTAVALERAESMQAGANTFASGAEKAAVDFVGGYANFVRALIEATYDDVERSFATVEKLADAKSVGEAMQIQADFVRDNTQINYDRVLKAAETVRETVAENAETVREQASRYWPYEQKAA